LIKVVHAGMLETMQRLSDPGTLYENKRGGSTTEEILERKSTGLGLESHEYGRRDPSH
jgi:hypothetical protein